MDKRYQVFVSSTYEDLKDERQHVTQALLRMGCIPSGMELFPASDEDQWTLIKRVIDDCDYFLLVIGGRYGSTGEDGIGYTEMEYNYAIETEKPVIAFLPRNPGSIPQSKSEQDARKKRRLEAFREKVRGNKKMADFYESPSDLAYKVSHGVTELKKTRPKGGWVRADSAQQDSEEVQRLRSRVEELEKQLSESKADRLTVDITDWRLNYSTLEDRQISPATPETANWVDYNFMLRVFNNSEETIGLHRIVVFFSSAGKTVFQSIPYSWSRELPHGWENKQTLAIALPAREWLAGQILGILRGGDMQSVRECDSVWLSAETTDGTIIERDIATLSG